jgi:hypothetical protein
VRVITKYRTLWDALETLPHPLVWDAFFDGRPEGRPFLWIADEFDP